MRFLWGSGLSVAKLNARMIGLTVLLFNLSEILIIYVVN